MIIFFLFSTGNTIYGDYNFAPKIYILSLLGRTGQIFLSIFNVDRCQTSSSVPFSYECGNNALVSILGQPQEQKTKCEKTWFYFLKVLFFYGKYRKYYPIPRSPSILFSTSRYEMMIKSSDLEYAIPFTQTRVELPHLTFMQRNF